jgi:Crp-like helix-turn-helix domain
MLRLQADRLAGIRARLGWPRHMSTDAWVACRLASLFDTRELFNRRFAIRLTQSALSEFLGLSRQRTNMALNSLRMRAGIDQRYGGLRIEDASRLILLAVNGAF